jgi:hypothetical protein
MNNDATGVLAIVSIVVSIGGSILAVVNHTRIRSVCCGRKLDVSLDVERTTPPSSIQRSDTMVIKIPQNKSEATVDV